MRQDSRCTFDDCCNVIKPTINRREALGSVAVALLGLLSGSALGGERSAEEDTRVAGAALAERTRRRLEESQAFAERMRNAGPDERMQIMREHVLAQHQQAIENLKEQLGISDKEWAVIKPRLETVYNLVHPLPQIRGANASTQTEVEQRSGELRELLRDKDADVDQIKAKLTALRAAKEKANEKLTAAQRSLRRLMTIRQEAVLVLNGLLD